MNAPQMQPLHRTQSPLRAFEGCGIELEYALVRADTLDVAPMADAALRQLSGACEPVCDVSRGMFGWSNELAMHVLELKNADPTVPIDVLAFCFQYEIRSMNAALADLGVRLMPAGMHPWMNPRTETRLWPHANAEIYRAYDRIFDCRSHGYANLQSMHLNMPFADDAEFARLHDAIRLVLPILPALAASSPFVEGRRAQALDYRLVVYRGNAAAVPQITADLVPERCADRAQYHAEVLTPMYAAIAAHDRDGLLQHEWLNARGAIARFDRNAIEIRVLDTQECPRMDLGIAALVLDLVQALNEARLAPLCAQAISTATLVDILECCVRDADMAWIEHPKYFAAFGLKRSRCRAAALWEEIAARLATLNTPRVALWRRPLEHILNRGTLARRLIEIAGRDPTRARLGSTYETLCDALEAGCPID